MAIKVNGTTVIDDSSNVCANSVCTCCVDASSTVTIPSGNTAGRPTGAVGELYFDTDEGKLVAHDGTDWAVAGGSGTAPDCRGIYHHGFYSPCWFGSRSYCYYRTFQGNTAALAPNGSNLVVSRTCMAGDQSPAGVYCCYSQNEVAFWYENHLCSHSYQFGGRNLSDSPQKNFPIFSREYCGLDDVDPRATPMIVTDRPENCNCSPVAFIKGFDCWCARCTCAQFNTAFYTSCTCPINTLFKPSGFFGTWSCGLGQFISSDFCCGVWIGFASQYCCFCCSTNGKVMAAFGFKPCYFYTTECCSTAAASPVQFESFCTNWASNGGRVYVAIDWPSKTVGIVSDWGNCALASKYCICDKGFPDCQSCWCMTCTPISSYLFCSSSLTSVAGTAMFCHPQGYNYPAKIWNDCLITFGCSANFIQVFPFNGGQSFTYSACTPNTSNCYGCMCFYNIFIDNECNLRIFGRMPYHVNTPTNPYLACCNAGIYEFLFTQGADLKSSSPCQLNNYRIANNCCNVVYPTGAYRYANGCDGSVNFEPISNRLTIPILWTNCCFCGGGNEGSIAIICADPKACTSSHAIGYSFQGDLYFYKCAAATSCYRLNQCVGSSCCVNAISVCTRTLSGSPCYTLGQYYTCLYRCERSGVALCPGIKTLTRCNFFYESHCYAYCCSTSHIALSYQKFRLCPCV